MIRPDKAFNQVKRIALGTFDRRPGTNGAGLWVSPNRSLREIAALQ
jgi:hypothetical protein